MKLRSAKNWTALSALLDQFQSTHGEPDLPSHRQLFFDLYGEACLFTGRTEEALGLLLKAYKLDEVVSTSPQGHFKHTRLNYLIALHYEHDDDFTSELCVRLVSNPMIDLSRVDLNIILMWLNHLKAETPQYALGRCMGLIGEVPALERTPVINTWLEETLFLLR